MGCRADFGLRSRSVSLSSVMVVNYLTVSIIRKRMEFDTDSTSMLQELLDLAYPFLMNADSVSSMGMTKRSSGLVRRLVTAPRTASNLGHYGSHRNEN